MPTCDQLDLETLGSQLIVPKETSLDIDLRSLLGAIELTIQLCAFVCGVGYFNAHIKETLLYK